MTDTSPGASHRSLAPRTPGTPPGRRKLTLVGGQPVRNCRTVGAERGEPGSTPTPARPPVTPLADAVARLRQESVASFHALPWSGGKALRDSASRQQYVDLFGDDFWNADVSYSGPVLDSFFRPVGPLDHAQHEAAEAFGATYTFFITAGTTLANQVALDAVAGPHSRVLVDPTGHQSVHFASAWSAATIDYGRDTGQQVPAAPPVADLAEMVDQVARAERAGRPYHVVVLSASSYDGVLYDLVEVFDACLAASPGLTFVVDEAWTAVHAFHPRLRGRTALAAAQTVARRRGTPPPVLVTHSAHKSMTAARQGSYLHVLGSADLVEAVRQAIFRRHTTSPSMPILVSLDLARAHAQQDGHRLLDRALRLARRFRDTLERDPRLAGFGIRPVLPARPDLAGYLSQDPLRVVVNASGSGLTGGELRTILFRDYRVYISRAFDEGFLLNFHIGVDDPEVDRLLDALRSIAARRATRGRMAHVEVRRPGEPVQEIVIAYPPGVPVAYPGDTWTGDLRRSVEAHQRAGAELFAAPARSPASASDPMPSLPAQSRV